MAFNIRHVSSLFWAVIKQTKRNHAGKITKDRFLNAHPNISLQRASPMQRLGTAVGVGKTLVGRYWFGLKNNHYFP